MLRSDNNPCRATSSTQISLPLPYAVPCFNIADDATGHSAVRPGRHARRTPAVSRPDRRTCGRLATSVPLRWSAAANPVNEWVHSITSWGLDDKQTKCESCLSE